MSDLTKREKKVLRRLLNGWHLSGYKRFMLIRDNLWSKQGYTLVRTKTALILIKAGYVQMNTSGDRAGSYTITELGIKAYNRILKHV